MSKKRYTESELIKELVKNSTMNISKCNTISNQNNNATVWSNLPCISDFFKSVSRQSDNVSQVSLLINEHIDAYLSASSLELELEQKKHWSDLKNLLTDKAGKYGDIQSLVFIRTMENLIKKGNIQLLDLFFDDNDLRSEILKCYNKTFSNWLLLALQSHQEHVFDYLASNSILNIDLNKMSVVTSRLGGSYTSGYMEIFPTSELMAIILSKNPVFIAYIINYDDKYSLGLRFNIIKALKEYYPEGLEWLEKIELYKNLKKELILPEIEINDENELVNQVINLSSKELDLFKI